MSPLPKILRTSRHRTEIHQRGRHPNHHKRRNHDPKRPSPLTRIPINILRATLVRECRQYIPSEEEDAGDERQRSGTVAVAEEAEEGDGKVES